MKRAEIQLGWKSIPGYRHQVEGRENEDTLLVAREHPLFDAVMLVADGMGGHPEPKLASETAARAAREFLFDPDHWQPLLQSDARGPLRLLRAAVQQANAAVRALAGRVAGSSPPATTLSAAVIADGRLYVAHAGDGSVLLMRGEQLRPLAGGEGRREGNRPQAFLGRADRADLEEAVVDLRPGDRVLLCTDGLTRYFGAARPAPGVECPVPGKGGPAPARHWASGTGHSGRQAGSALHEVLARRDADPQAVANQLTAHGRGEQYDDDTTVVVADVLSFREAPAPFVEIPHAAHQTQRGTRSAQRAARSNPNEARRRSALSGWATVGAMVGTLALGWGGGLWWAGRGAGRDADVASGSGPTASPLVADRSPPPAALSPSGASLAVGPVAGLPQEPLVLLDPRGGTLFVLEPRARPRGAPEGRVTLLGARLLPDGQMARAGDWSLDVEAGRLTDPKGREFFVTVDVASGVIRARHAGILRVRSRPEGARVYLDGVALGRAPLEKKVPAGAHRLRLVWSEGQSVEQSVEVPPRGTLALEIVP